MFRRIRRLLTLAVVVLAALFLLGLLYERSAKARDARAFPPVGRMVDVGGRRLHLLCIGTGAPVVLFEASGFGNALSSGVARGTLAKDTTVCSYDRMGVGWSDPGPAAISVGAIVSDLTRLLDEAAISTPVIVVTSSVGGLVTELFARQHPSRVAGLVFLDAATSDMVTQVATVDLRGVRFACAVVKTAGRSGALRLMDPFDLRAGPPDGGRSVALMYGAQPWNALCALVAGVAQTVQEFAAAPPLVADVPLTVLSAESERGLAPPALARWFERPVLARWFEPPLASRVERHQQLARRSSRGQWRMIPGQQPPDLVEPPRRCRRRGS